MSLLNYEEDVSALGEIFEITFFPVASLNIIDKWLRFDHHYDGTNLYKNLWQIKREIN